jgi:hypothetical protein
MGWQALGAAIKDRGANHAGVAIAMAAALLAGSRRLRRRGGTANSRQTNSQKQAAAYPQPQTNSQG